MEKLVKAEFRKVFSTNIWWTLLIPTALVAFVWALIWSAFGGGLVDQMTQDPDFQQLGVNLHNTPVSVFALSRAINITTVFPMLLGGLALSTEIRHKTLTTTYLTAPGRVSVLSAKLITYTVWGAIYGVVISLAATGGIALGSTAHTDLLPDATAWLQIAAAGVLESVLWTLLAVGVGAIFGTVVGTVITLLMYSIVVENLVTLVLPGHGPGFLPNQAGDGITSALATQTYVHSLPPIPTNVHDNVILLIQFAAGARGVFDWWVSALIFLLYSGIFFGIGWAVTENRDVT
ncbi:MAG TPA: hypothetical protein VG317_10355 [Pseudonocardiaceae bacterium]|jgi:ABC-2 type transport system permease protein|nr:hypothetical protein [Pseudonocardiaceae bacterium]